MGDSTLTADEAEGEFWKRLESSRTGMLGRDQPGYHAQPMMAFREGESGVIWFFTRDDTDLAREAASGQSATFTYASKDQEVWACIQGMLSVTPRNPALIDKHWNPILAAWYPEGKDDPHLTLLRFDAGDGRIWVSKKGAVGFFYEVAKANLTKTTPDVGGVADVNLR